MARSARVVTAAYSVTAVTATTAAMAVQRDGSGTVAAVARQPRGLMVVLVARAGCLSAMGVTAVPAVQRRT